MRTLATFLGIFLCMTFMAISATIYMKSFQASVQGTSVKIDWVISEESGIQKFLVYRKQGGSQQFTYVTSINPNGTRNYTYSDNNLISNSGAENITYKITADTQGQDLEFFTSVVYSPTTVQRTWGSIKAMFK